MRRYLGALVFAAFLAGPVTALADDHDHDKDHRYYDPYRKDYHEWNEREDRAYRHWQQDVRHQEYHDWNRARDRERRDYWRWRHDHEDWDDRR